MKPVPTDARADAAEKPVCPACRSKEVSTKDKSTTKATYWRCDACGEIWNQSRLVTSGGRRW